MTATYGPQRDIGRGIAAVVATWTDVLDSARCDYGMEWDAVGHGVTKGRALVIPRGTRLAADAPVIAASGVFEYDFEVRFELLKRSAPQDFTNEVLRLCRGIFQPESRAVQAAVAALTSPTPSGDILGATVVMSMGEPSVTTREGEGGGEDNWTAPIVLVPVTARACEDLS